MKKLHLNEELAQLIKEVVDAEVTKRQLLLRRVTELLTSGYEMGIPEDHISLIVRTAMHDAAKINKYREEEEGRDAMSIPEKY